MSEEPPKQPPSRPSRPTDPTLASDPLERDLARLGSGTPTTIANPSHPHGKPQPPGPKPPPDRIGPYFLRSILGEGGMGVVYLAERIEPVRMTVALKLIKLGMDTAEVVARFESERQALALMSHPNIARVLDAGAAEDGRPYFVMEFVPGEPITSYCDKHRLTNSERLALFVTVCEAVQHAHSKGLIHRDLKPSNVLIMVQETRPVPKIIDFGVAKAINQRLTEKTLFTQHGQLVGTPEYMSPEQAEMSSLDIDNRSDIYSLGVLLYELLVGALPFDSTTLRRAGFAEIQRIIREVDPPKPSTRLSTMEAAEKKTETPGTTPARPTTTSASSAAQHRRLDIRGLQRQLRGDLDWITMKAMDKDRTRRYASAEAFGEDITRYLASMPIQARPPSIPYKLRKFVRRRRTALILSGSLAACIVLAVTLVIASHRARLRRSTDLTNLAVKQMRQMDHVSAEKSLREALELNAANYVALNNFATVKRFEYEKLRDPKMLDEALVMLDRAIAAESNRAEPWNIKGVFLRQVGRNAEAIAAFKKGIAADKGYFATYVSLANAYVVAGDFDNAEKVLLVADTLPGTHDDPRPWQRWYNLAAIQLALGKPEAITAIKKALDAGGSLDAAAGRKSSDVWLLYAKVLLLLPSSFDAPAARDALVRANDDPSKPSWKIQRLLALAELRKGNPPAAITAARSALDMKDPLPAYDRLIIAVAEKAAKPQTNGGSNGVDSAVPTPDAWPDDLKKNKLAATIDAGLIWIETLAELESLHAEAR